MTERAIRGDLTTLRPATEADLPLLTGWLADPEVYRWWDGTPATAADLRRRGYTGSRRPQKEPFIVEAAGAPVGYIQCWAADATSGGIDLFLVPGARGRGLGPDAARALVRHLLTERGWRRVTVDPAAGNAPAIRAWEKAGFAFERVWPDHPDGPAVLMAVRAPAPGGADSRDPTPLARTEHRRRRARAGRCPYSRTVPRGPTGSVCPTSWAPPAGGGRRAPAPGGA